MSVTNINVNSESTIAHELPAGMHEGIVLPDDADSTWLNAPRSILQSALAALSDGRISEAAAHFDEGFKFNDHALALEFTDKLRLTEFFQKAREQFPDAALKLISLMESGDHAIAEWKLTATQTVPYGSISCRFPVSLQGSTIVRVERGRIVEWSDYYDHASSRRMGLASHFTDWIEY
ncbi:MAG TPA: ester cyclase [Terriglobales bacterium]|nr:ester cyclase [Terriglobales bacterium]